jgi:hypothetical protein
MKITKTYLMIGSLLAAATAILSFVVKHKGAAANQYYIKSSPDSPCITATCTTLNMGQGVCIFSNSVFYTDYSCLTLMSPQPNLNNLYVALPE